MSDVCSFEILEGRTLNERLFNGAIEKYRLDLKLEFYRFEFVSNREFTIHLESESDSTFYICVNLSMKNSLELGCNNKLISIPSYSSFLIPLKNSSKLCLKAKEGQKCNYSLLRIIKSHLDEEQRALLNSLQFAEFGDILNSERSLMPNLNICEVVRKLNAIDKKTCENKFIAAGYANILIGLKLNEFSYANASKSKYTSLRGFEINQLELLTNQIMKNPQNQYSISELCRRTGLSVFKLQSGFKEMHDCTVAIFIRNVRLDKALQLLKNTDLNVSEIVYSVGLSSRSYFCRIFKKRFKCSPKNYQQKLRDSMLTAV